MASTNPADPKWFRQVLGQYPTGVCVVTATEPGGGRVGFVVGSFTSVSLDPPLIAFFPAKTSRTWRRIHRAGRFCVNILSADQEELCRRFASRMDDKFEGVAFRETRSGAPIISGVVAWIDCDLESVNDAGDHYIVLGRARRLELEQPSLPLLFFQGGYGRFAPLSLAAGNARGLLSEQLREVDLVRSEMERVAADIPDARCTASALVAGEIVVTASAGGVTATSAATPVGQRLPFMPPIGAALAAWLDEAQLIPWLEHLPSEEERADQREALAAVRTRGFSVALRTEAQRAFVSTLARLEADRNAVDHTVVRGRVQALGYEPICLTEEVKRKVAVITVPVFGGDEQVAMMLTVSGFPEPTGPEVVDGYIERMLITGRHATRLIGGVAPARG